MEARGSRSRVVFVAAVGCLIALNLVVLAAAYPETMRLDSGCCGDRTLAKDFSAFYTAAWRLIHNPGQMYTAGYVDDGEFLTLPQPETYKYLPSLALMVLPFLALPYQEALTVFDVFQFLLLPLIALLVYELTEKKGVVTAIIIAIIALLLPSPGPGSGLSFAYFWQWGEGQSKVLETFLLLTSFYAGKRGSVRVSGAVFALTAFDPRFTLLSLPLFLTYNRGGVRRSAVSFLFVFFLTNAPLIYPPTGEGFLRELVAGGLGTPIYPYALIPILTVLALTAANITDVVAALRAISFNGGARSVTTA